MRGSRSSGRYTSIGFDLDGTLIDSRAAVRDAIFHVIPRFLSHCRREAILHEGLVDSLFPLTLGAYRQALGIRDDEVWQQFVEAFTSRFDNMSVHQLEVWPGAFEALMAANDRVGRGRTYLLTNRRLESARKILELTGLSDFFAVVRQTTDDGTRNPKVASLGALVAEFSGVGRGVYVGDSSLDMEAALANGLDGVWVRSSRGMEENIVRGGSNGAVVWCITSIQESVVRLR